MELYECISDKNYSIVEGQIPSISKMTENRLEVIHRKTMDNNISNLKRVISVVSTPLGIFIVTLLIVEAFSQLY